MVKDSPTDRSITLQALDNPHALNELFTPGFQLADLPDPVIQHGNLPADIGVTGDLPFDGAVDPVIAQQNHANRHDHDPHQ
ncbi:hypothetical protein D3C71_1815280 [compost metagenome]